MMMHGLANFKVATCTDGPQILLFTKPGFSLPSLEKPATGPYTFRNYLFDRVLVVKNKQIYKKSTGE
jgi:hypothetical protein